MSNTKIPYIYLKDLNSIAEALNGLESAGKFLWVTGDIKVTDGDIVYTLVYEDNAWWLDTEHTTVKE